MSVRVSFRPAVDRSSGAAAVASASRLHTRLLSREAETRLTSWARSSSAWKAALLSSRDTAREMSQENVEIVCRAYELLNRGDIEGVVKLCDDDFLMDMTERVFNPDTYRGHDGIRRFYEGVRDAWESYQWNVEETRIAGDSVVVMLHCEGQSREGGPGVDWRVAWLWNLRRGRPVSLRFYRHRAEALEAAGLV